MTTRHSHDPFSCVIVGGGVHGIYCCQRLLEDTPLTQSEIAIVDPHNRLLASFRRKARACGMEALRSTFVQHVGTEPFGLESFAEAHDREDELHATVDYPDRPSLELFLDHTDHVIDAKGLDALHIETTVDRIRKRDQGGFRLTTAEGRIDAHTCVLAIGHGDRYRIPDWAGGVDGVDHVWNGFDPDRQVDETIIVGGGITAAQLADSLGDQRVTMVTRHPLRWEVSEADPPWLNWNHIERELHCHPPASNARLETIREARYAATIPPDLYDCLDSRVADGRLRILQGEVDSATNTDDHVRLNLDDGDRLAADRVVLATGFEPAYQHPFVDRVATTMDLARGYGGLPLLDDDTLAWQAADGQSRPLYVSGALAVGVVGPYSPNIPGARRAADRIAPAIETAVSHRPVITS